MAIIRKARRKPSMKPIEGDKLRPLVEEYLKRATAQNLGYLRGLRNVEARYGRDANVEYLTKLLRWVSDQVRSEFGQDMQEPSGDLEPVTK